MQPPKDFFRPLALGAPTPVREVPARPSRMIHFFDPSNEKMAAKVPDIAKKADVVLGNLEDAISADKKDAAREGLVSIAQATDFGETQLWTRINSLDSPWCLPDLTRLVPAIGDKLDVIMVPKVEGAEDIHYIDRLLAQLEAQAGLKRPILVHALLETARGVANVEEICGASPRMQGLSLGPADLAADRRMKTTRVGGGHPGYVVREDPSPDDPEAPRASFQQDLWHFTMARMVGTCATYGIFPCTGAPSATSATPGRVRGPVPQRLPDGLRRRGRCTRCRSTSPRGVLAPSPPGVAGPATSSTRWATAPVRS
ncbi:MAG: aldolase/citrate lyase family protein [Microthrixaceae bacterium]